MAGDFRDAMLKAVDDAACEAIGAELKNLLGNEAGGEAANKAEEQFRKAVTLTKELHDRARIIVESVA